MRSNFLLSLLVITAEISCFADVDEIGTRVTEDLQNNVKESCLELLASSDLIDWNTFERRVKVAQEALDAFSTRLAQYKSTVSSMEQTPVSQPSALPKIIESQNPQENIQSEMPPQIQQSAPSTQSPESLPVLPTNANVEPPSEPAKPVENIGASSGTAEEPLPAEQPQAFPTSLPVPEQQASQSTATTQASDGPQAVLPSQAPVPTAPEESQPAVKTETQAAQTPASTGMQTAAETEPPLTEEEMKEAKEMLEFFQQMAAEQKEKK